MIRTVSLGAHFVEFVGETTSTARGVTPARAPLISLFAASLLRLLEALRQVAV